MRLNQTAAVASIEQYPSFVHNCLRNRTCEPPFGAPLPGVQYLQLYVDFGIYQPVLSQFFIQDTCADTPPEQLFPSNYVVGQNPDGRWYGVFKYFNEPMVPVTAFVIWLDVFIDAPGGLLEATYFSELLQMEPCLPLLKVKACQPADSTTTGFDVNGVYYGLPTNLDFQGEGAVRYFHIAWVRLGKVRELSNKATFVSSLFRTFRSVLEKTWQLESEMVPKWYKDELLGIFMRGAVQVNDGTTYLVSDLAFEALNDDDLRWKPFAQLKATYRLYFGCDEGACVECCSPLIIDASAHTPESASAS